MHRLNGRRRKGNAKSSEHRVSHNSITISAAELSVAAIGANIFRTAFAGLEEGVALGSNYNDADNKMRRATLLAQKQQQRELESRCSPPKGSKGASKADKHKLSYKSQKPKPQRYVNRGRQDCRQRASK